MQLQYSLFCLGYDESKGAPTFQFVVHELPLGPFPYAFPDGSGVFWVNGFTDILEPGRVRLSLTSPQGSKILDQELEIKPDPETGRVLSVAFLEGVTFPMAGRYNAEVWRDEHCLSRHGFEVIEVEPG